MKHALLIIAHNNWNQLRRFIEAIDSHKCDFFVHINSKVPISNEIKDDLKGACKRSKIYFAKRVPIVWGDFGICEAALELLKASTNRGVRLLSSSYRQRFIIGGCWLI